MTHALAPDLGTRHFNAALVTHCTGVPDALVLPAVALPVPLRAKDPFAEQTAVLGLERAVVDRFRLGYFAERPATDIFWRSQADTNRVEIVDVKRLPAIVSVHLSHCLHY